jgi:DNA-binding transcriptional LysR family regulator
VAVLPTLATTWLAPRLPDFQRRCGDIAVSLSSRTLPFQFSDHPFDAAIYHADHIWPRTTGIKLFDEGELWPVCTPALLASAGKAGDSLDRLPHLHMMSRPDAWRHWYRAQNRDYAPSISAGPRYELFTITLAAAQAGLGVALIPRFLAHEELSAGRLVLAASGALKVREAYYFSYPTHSEPTEALLAFESWLADMAKTMSESVHKEQP